MRRARLYTCARHTPKGGNISERRALERNPLDYLLIKRPRPFIYIEWPRDDGEGPIRSSVSPARRGFAAPCSCQREKIEKGESWRGSLCGLGNVTRYVYARPCVSLLSVYYGL